MRSSETGDLVREWVKGAGLFRHDEIERGSITPEPSRPPARSRSTSRHRLDDPDRPTSPVALAHAHPRPQEGSPPPPIHYKLPYFLGFVVWGVGQAVCLGLYSRWSRVDGMTAVKRLGRSRLAALVGLPPSLRSVGLVRALHGVWFVCLKFALRIGDRRVDVPPSGALRMPTAGPCRCPLVLYYCFYLTSYPRQRVLLIACNGASGRSPFPATKTLRA